MKPFKSKKTQKSFSLIVGLTGLLIVASTLNSNPAPAFIIGSASISYKVIGSLMFLIGLIYIIETLD